MRKLANCAARDIASPAAKMGSKSLFPGVAVPLAFFCTLFFRHRKKSVSAPWDGKSLSAPESARQAPPGAGDCACGRTGGFPRGKQSARFALPCAPLVVCLNSGSLIACGGCIHWIPASLRSPLETFGSPPEAIERPIGLQALPPRRTRRVKPRYAPATPFPPE